MVTVLAGALLVASGQLPEVAIDRSGSTTTLRFDGGPSIRTTKGTVADVQAYGFPGSSVRLATWTERSGKTHAPYYAISLDGRTVQRVTPTEYDVRLQYGSFDPKTTQPAVPSDLAAGGHNEIYLVQFVTQPIQEFRDAVEQAGGEFYHYVSNHAYLVRLDDEARGRVEELPFVRAVAPYHPAYRTDSVLRARLAAGTLPASHLYNVQLLAEGKPLMEEAKNLISMMGAEITRSVPENAFLTVRLTPEQFVELLHLNVVSFADLWSPPEQDMNLLRQLDGVDYINGFGNFDGSGMNIAVMDGGFQTAHIAFLPRVMQWQTATATDAHGTACLGINIGDGDGNATGRGILPAAGGVIAAYSAYLNGAGDRNALTAQLLTSPYNALFQTNSWGDARVLTYTTISAQMDSILYNNDVVILQSQSNAGNQQSRPQAWSKNIVSVGGAYHFDNTNWADDRWQAGASIGPAADLRTKPDICNAYDAGITTYTTTTTGYANFSGTSQATPVSAGLFGVFFQMWHQGHFGNAALNSTVFSNRPKASLAKAFMINTARMYGSANVDTNRNVQGWGVPSLQNLWDRRSGIFWVNETDVLQNLQTKTYRLYVPAGTAEFKATLVYLDPAGTVGAAQARKNNLSLRVTVPGGTQYWGNNGMKGATFQNTTLSGGSENLIDTVENVFLAAPVPGTYIIEVMGSDINTDARVETTGVIDADFALVVNGVQQSLAPTSFSTSTGSLISGGLAELARSENARVVQGEGTSTENVGNGRSLIVSATSPVASLSQVGFLLEGRTGISSGKVKAYFWNWTTNAWDLQGDYAMGTADAAATGSFSSGASNYVHPTSREVRAKFTFRNSNAAVDLDFNSETDLVRILVHP